MEVARLVLGGFLATTRPTFWKFKIKALPLSIFNSYIIIYKRTILSTRVQSEKGGLGRVQLIIQAYKAGDGREYIHVMTRPQEDIECILDITFIPPV